LHDHDSGCMAIWAHRRHQLLRSAPAPTVWECRSPTAKACLLPR